jgi:putative peptidoglycan lipid II flippase
MTREDMKKKLLKSTLVFSVMTFVSRLTGLLREMVFAYCFGATAAMDAFNIAYRVPNFLRGLFGDGAFSQAFVPVLSEYRQNKNPEEVKLFLDHIAGVILVSVFLLTLVAVLAAPLLVYIFAPGFVSNADNFGLTVSMLRITFPYVLFISLSSYVTGILNSYGRFGVPAFTPALLNLALVGSAIWGAPYFKEPIKALAWGVLVGGMVQLLFQLPLLLKIKLLPNPKFVWHMWHNSGVKKVLKLMGPAILGVSVTQISFLLDNILASFLQSGSIAWLSYSNHLALFPMGIFGVAIATVILPYLSRKHISQSAAAFSMTLDWALRCVLVIAIPAAIGLAMLAGPIIVTLFQFKGGQFNSVDVLMVRRSLWVLSLGIPAFMLVKVLASSFYARQNIRTPVKVAAISLGANVLLAITLIFPLKHMGLALATSITSTINAALLFYMMWRDGFYQPSSGWLGFLLRIIFANGVLLLLICFISNKMSFWFELNSSARLLRLAVICFLAMFSYVIALGISGMKLKDFVYTTNY